MKRHDFVLMHISNCVTSHDTNLTSNQYSFLEYSEDKQNALIRDFETEAYSIWYKLSKELTESK
jgi:hypothetical protein